MANRLKTALVDSIYTLRELVLSQPRLARLLRIDRETVRRHFRLMAAGSNPAGAPCERQAGTHHSHPRGTSKC